MVFSSIPGYLDPSNWQQQHQQHHLQQNHQSGFHHGINISSNSNSINPSGLTNPNPLLPPPPLPPPQQPRAQPPPHTGPMSASGSLIRPGSMAERARMANIPMPEVALKCPRCESTNTKFCYFNNYSLSQPRHFCKTCRRYWTRGGALRSVPVGGGCRRNKRSKSTSSNSKSSATSGGDRERSSSAAAATSSASSAGGSVSHSSMAELMGLASPPPQLLSNLRFMSPLHHLTDMGEQLGLSSYGAGDSGFHLGGIGSGGAEQWRIANPPGPTQFPFLGGMDGAGSSLYGHHPYEGVEFSNLAIGGSGGPLRGSKAVEAPMAEMVKVEEERGHEEMRLVRGFNMGMDHNNQENGEEQQYNNWGGNGSNSSGNGWTDLSALNNSSCSTTSAL